MSYFATTSILPGVRVLVLEYEYLYGVYASHQGQCLLCWQLRIDKVPYYEGYCAYLPTLPTLPVIIDKA